MSKSEQKYLALSEHNGQRHNFFFSAGSLDSIDSLLKDGWRVIYIRDENYNTAVLLERVTREALEACEGS